MQFVLKEGLVSNQILGGSRVALEEAFFARENAKLRQQLRDVELDQCAEPLFPGHSPLSLPSSEQVGSAPRIPKSMRLSMSTQSDGDFGGF